MPTLILQASDDHVQRLAREGDPLRAVIELILNTIDAEARRVVVEFERQEFGAISLVRVVDDGHGITSNEVESTFGRIGGSWKKLSVKSKNGLRVLHAKSGEGRLRAFALGTVVSWESDSDDPSGKREHVTICGSRSSRDHFCWEARASDAPTTGTILSAENQAQFLLTALDSDAEALVAESVSNKFDQKEATHVTQMELTVESEVKDSTVVEPTGDKMVAV